MTFVVTCLTLPFIIADLIYANNDTTCVNEPVNNMSLTLKTWLEVDAYVKIGVICYFICAFIYNYVIVCTPLAFICVTLFMLLFGLFNFAWIIVGAVLFWGDLDQRHICDQSLTAYMYAILIIGLVGAFGQCCRFFCSSDKDK